MNVLGIDVSSRAIDLVLLDENTNAAQWTRLGLADGTPFERLRSVASAMPQPGWFESHGVYLVGVERPRVGSFVSAGTLLPVYGAVVASLPDALPVWGVEPHEWRHGLGLAGNASKDDCARKVLDLAWDEGNWSSLAASWPQDALDAYAVAYYARETNAAAVAAELA